MTNDKNKTKQHNKRKKSMKNKFSASMFDALKEVMSAQQSSGNFKDIIKTPIGNNYIVRLCPDVNNIANTTYHYYMHGWGSLATGQYVSCVCPTTRGERCPICEERVRLYRGSEEDVANAKLLGRKEQWLVNVLVVDNPASKDDNGNVKILRYGKQLDKIIRSAIDGIDREEFGARIFDLSKDGCNLRVSVEKNDGGYPSYVSSKFLRESAVDVIAEKDLDTVYENIFELSSIFESKSADEVQDLLNIHFNCVVSNSMTSTSGTEVNVATSNIAVHTDPVIPTVKTVEAPAESTGSAPVSGSSEDIQSKLKDLMSGL